jgi:drug/metabolite transporter (DMT)-like permease
LKLGTPSNPPSAIHVPQSGGLAPHVALVVVQLVFGTWPIFGKIALRVLPSTGLVAFRIAGAAAAFLLLRRLKGRLVVPERRDLARFALYSLLGVVVNQFLFTRGLALSTATNAALLGTAIPVFTLLVSTLLGYEKFSGRAALGTAVAAAGVIYLVDPLSADFSGDKTLGNLLLVANTLAYGAYLALTQDAFRRFGALTAMAWVFALGSVVAVPVGGYQLAQTQLSEVSPGVWLVVLYIVLVPTVGAYYLNAWALERVTPSTVAVYVYLQPLIAYAVAPLVLGAEEGWNARTLTATILIFAGVAIVTLRSRSRVLEEVSERPDAPAR